MSKRALTAADTGLNKEEFNLQLEVASMVAARTKLLGLSADSFKLIIKENKLKATKHLYHSVLSGETVNNERVLLDVCFSFPTESRDLVALLVNVMVRHDSKYSDEVLKVINDANTLTG